MFKVTNIGNHKGMEKSIQAQILQLLKSLPSGLQAEEIGPRLNLTRHTMAKYLEVLYAGGKLTIINGERHELTKTWLDSLISSMYDCISWLERVPDRKRDDGKLIQAVYNQCRAQFLWAEVCTLNKAIASVLDEKTMYFLYVLGILQKSSQVAADFYEEMRDEVKDYVHRGVAAQQSNASL